MSWRGHFETGQSIPAQGVCHPVVRWVTLSSSCLSFPIFSLLFLFYIFSLCIPSHHNPPLPTLNSYVSHGSSLFTVWEYCWFYRDWFSDNVRAGRGVSDKSLGEKNNVPLLKIRLILLKVWIWISLVLILCFGAENPVVWLATVFTGQALVSPPATLVSCILDIFVLSTCP